MKENAKEIKEKPKNKKKEKSKKIFAFAWCERYLAHLTHDRYAGGGGSLYNFSPQKESNKPWYLSKDLFACEWSLHMKHFFTNSFSLNAHILSKLYRRVQHQPHFNLTIHHTKYFPTQIKNWLSFINTATNTSRKVINYVVKQSFRWGQYFLNIVDTVVCADPGERPNARRLEGVGPYLVDSTVTYVCDNGNAIGRIFCQSNGQWTTLSGCYGKKLIFSMQL